MVLLLRPDDNKVISVSRHKVHCHEETYTKYDHSTGGNLLEHFAVPKVDLEGEKTKGENLQTIKEYKEKFKIPDHVLSVKCLSDFNRHPEMNEALPRTAPPEKQEKSLRERWASKDVRSRSGRCRGETFENSPGTRRSNVADLYQKLSH